MISGILNSTISVKSSKRAPYIKKDINSLNLNEKFKNTLPLIDFKYFDYIIYNYFTDNSKG